MKVRDNIIIIMLLTTVLIPFKVNAKSNYLYDVLKNEAETGGLAKEYTGEHHDSFTEEPSKKIYHWYTDNYAEGTEIKNKNNVIFANHCWQMIRTTDTGGVKLLYNGEVNDEQCLNTRGNHTGYLYKTRINLNANYWYGTSYIKSGYYYKISGDTIQAKPSSSNMEELIGKYTCKNTQVDNSCLYLYYIEDINKDNMAEALTITSDSHYSTIGKTKKDKYSLAYAGYMYNQINDNNSNIISNKEEVINTTNLLTITDIWFADEISYDSTTKKYSLVNPYKIDTSDELSNLKGKYTLNAKESDFTRDYAYYIINCNNSSCGKVLSLKSGKLLDDVNASYTFGNNFTDNGDGTYTITSYVPQTIKASEWNNNYNYKKGQYVCKNAVNNTCSDLWLVTFTTDTNFSYIKYDDIYLFGNSFTYTNGKYHLDGETKLWNSLNTSDLNNAHYTCFNKTGECETIKYVFDVSKNGYVITYIDLEKGKNIEEYIYNMLYADDVNRIDSDFKDMIDNWYENNLINYSDKLEDTIFCNDRTIDKKAGWNPNGGNPIYQLSFKNNSIINDISCKHETDKFSTENAKAKLKYKVGMITASEVNILGIYSVLANKTDFWTMTPSSHSTGDFAKPLMNYISSVGRVTEEKNGITNAYGIRPVISVKENTEYYYGDGSMENPYVLELKKYSIDVEIKNETEDINIEIDDVSQVTEGEEVKFKITPIKGFKVNDLKIIDAEENEIEYTSTDNKNYVFTMPRSNVTIKPSYERVSNSITIEENSNTKEFKIEVNDATAVIYEDKVVFKIIPEEGYETENIIITDENNNNIEYKKTSNENEYEFTMPDTNVTIKPIYRKKESPKEQIVNPNTGGLEMIFTIIILLSIVTGTYLYHKKDKKI